MLKNYLKIAIRNLSKQKVFSLINIAGLALGMACCILILLFIQDELSYDRYHQKTDQIYRVLRDNSACTSFPLAKTLSDNFPEIIEAVRITRKWERLVRYDDKKFNEKDFIYADPNVFNIFCFPLIMGDPKTALKEPFTIVITEELAQKYFGDSNPIGKILIIENEYSYTVTGVMKQIPRNSHFRVDLIATLVGMDKVFYSGFFEYWGSWNAYTYLLLPKNSPIRELEAKFSDSIIKPIMAQNPQIGTPKLYLQRLTDIHLFSSDVGDNIEAQGDIAYVLIFSGIAVFILLIACINFMNLSTARASIRAKEVGVRKVSGASRPQLIKQFLGESLFFSIIAFLISLALVELFLPTINSLTDKALAFGYSGNWLVLMTLIGIILFVGLVAGCYPAFFLAAFQPVKILKGTSATGSRNLPLRRVLVVIQFTVSIALIVGTYTIFRQLHYLKNKKLGFDKEHVVVLNIPDPGALEKNDLFKNKLLQHTNILRVSSADRIPPDHLGWWTTFQLKESEKEVWLAIVCVNYGYFETLGIEITQGRSFSNTFITDKTEALILNESAVKELGLKSPIGSYIKTSSTNYPNRQVIGAVKDFHFESLYEKIKPIAFVIEPSQCWQLIVRIRSENISSTLDFIKTEWAKFYPEWVFQYRFLDENFDRQYRAEEKIGRFIGYFTLLAIFIACLGLFGLAAFTAEQRTKEIGIRKVLGASVSGIVVLLSKEFTKWVLIANTIAWPIAWYAMNKWLQNFAYRINIDIGTFFLAAVVALVIALVTVSFQALKAALANPVEALRYE